MTDSFWFSALLGASLAAVYSVAALWIGSIAQRSSSRTFMMIVMGGMVARDFCGGHHLNAGALVCSGRPNGFVDCIFCSLHRGSDH